MIVNCTVHTTNSNPGRGKQTGPKTSFSLFPISSFVCSFVGPIKGGLLVLSLVIRRLVASSVSIRVLWTSG